LWRNAQGAEGVKESCEAPSDAPAAQYKLALGASLRDKKTRSTFEVESLQSF